MAVQRKSNSNGPGEKKPINWLQVGVVAFILLVVVMCVLSFSNFSTLFNDNNAGSSAYGNVAEGDHAAVYFATNIGNTTTFAYMPTENNQDVIPYSIYADSNSSIVDDDYKSIMIGIGNTSIPYGIYALEQNAIAKGIVGAPYGSTVTIDNPYYVMVTCTADDLASLGYDIKNVKVGDVLVMFLGYEDVLGDKKSYARNGVVSSIEDDLSGLTLNCGEDTIDVYVYGKYTA
ncbi:MAG TPA: hypothetical protein O0X97_03725 [Methanocorpusculum sp.]|nr:hypothetical protein [Methanocorpusculum sp.]